MVSEHVLILILSISFIHH